MYIAYTKGKTMAAAVLLLWNPYQEAQLFSSLFFCFPFFSCFILSLRGWRANDSTCLALSCLAALNPLLVKRRRNLSPFVWRSGGASAERFRLGPLVGPWSALGRLDHITTTAGKDCLARTGSS